MTEWWSERHNALHLWLCAQPTDFALNQQLTSAQQEECKQLAELVYFGWRYHCTGFRTLDRNLPLPDKWIHPIPRVVTLAKIGPPTVGLGTLDQLPLEILSYIVSSLDISTIDQFKAMNRRSFEVVNTHPQFKIINLQAQDTLLGLRAIKTNHRITVQTLFEKLCTSQCSECGDYGGYMYLVTFERVCCRCFTEKDRYLPLREIDALRKFGLTLEILHTLPRFQGYPGHYGKGFFIREKKPYIPLIDRASAYDAGIVCHGSFEAMQEYVANINPNIWKDYKREIDGREKKLAVERAVKKREKKARWKAYLKKRNAYKREIWTRREEREIRKGKGIAFIEGIEDPGEDTDNESISTFYPETDTDNSSDDDTKGDSNYVRSDAEQRETEATSSEAFIEGVEDPGEDTANGSLSNPFSERDTDNTSDDNSKGDSNYVRSDPEQRETEAASSEDSSHDDELRSWGHLRFRYKGVMRVPWLNRKSGRDEWGFHCVGCEGLDRWPNHANRDFLMSTFREHLKECGPIKAGVHHMDDCCKKGTCREKKRNAGSLGYARPFWRC